LIKVQTYKRTNVQNQTFENKRTNVQTYKRTKIVKTKSKILFCLNKRTNVQTGVTQALYANLAYTDSCPVFVYAIERTQQCVELFIVTRRNKVHKHRQNLTSVRLFYRKIFFVLQNIGGFVF